MKRFFALFSFIFFLFITLFGVIYSNSTYAQTPSIQPTDQAFSKSAEFRVTLNRLLQAHTVLAASMLKGMYKGEDITQLQQLEKTNQSQLATVIQKVYGQNTANTFNQLWSAHMQEYMNYTSAVNNNDTTGMDNARKNLQTISNKLGTLLATKNLSSKTVTNLMNQHINGTLSYVDAVASNNLTQQANLMQQGFQQAGTFADTLSKGMMQDKPQMFQ